MRVAVLMASTRARTTMAFRCRLRMLRSRDIGGREAGGGNLIKQRLK
jgi:hypothetical protein